jgi:hypothetical protein
LSDRKITETEGEHSKGRTMKNGKMKNQLESENFSS